jgi:anti-sigma factor RsiW
VTLPSPHVTAETLAIYWADELTDAEQDAVEAHIYVCDACAAAWQRAAAQSRSLGPVVAPMIAR